MKLQFRLRTLMIAVTLLAVPLGYIGWQGKIVRGRKAMREHIKLVDDGECWPVRHATGSVPWIRQLLGDEEVVYFELPDTIDPNERRRIKEILTEATLVTRTNKVEMGVPFPND